MFICPAAAPCSVIFSAGGLRGGLLVTAPFVITGGNQAVSALSINGSINVPAVMTRTGSFCIDITFAEMMSGGLLIASSLSASDSQSVVLRIDTALGMESAVAAVNSLAEKLRGRTDCPLTLGDFGLSGSVRIIQPLYAAGHSGSLRISLPDSTVLTVSDTLTVTGGGTDITAKLKSAVINLFGGNQTCSVTADFTPLAKIPDSLTIAINGAEYSFDTVSAVTTKDGTEITAEAYALPEKKTLEHGVIRSDECAAIFEGVIHSSPAFTARDINGTFDGFELAALLAEQSGSFVRLMPDGRSMVFMPDKNSPVYEPADVISFEKRYVKQQPSGAEVIYGRSGENYVSIEPSVRKTRTGSIATVKVYGTDSKIFADGAEVAKTASGIYETVTEDVFFENGSGTLSRPALTLLTEGMKADGRKITSAKGCGYARVSYVTRFNSYEISSNSPADVTICARLDSRALVLCGSGEVKTVHAPHVCDYVTAVKIAKAYIASLYRTSKITALHSELINTPDGLVLKTPYVEGPITGAQINIENNPVRVTDILEVSAWQR